VSILEGSVTEGPDGRLDAGTSSVAGRARELAVADEVLDRARGRPATLILAGQAGVGKTTVWGATVARATTTGFCTLITRPVESDAKLAFASLTDLFEPVTDAVIAELPPPQAGALLVALRRADPGRVPPDGLGIALGVLGALRILSAGCPVLIAVDDVQWLDPPSAGALQFALHRLMTEPVAVVSTERTSGTHPSPVGARTIAAGEVVEIEVGPLGPEDLERVLRARLGVGFLRPTLLRIEAASGGNPFYAIEIGRGLLRAGARFAPDVLPIPDTLAGVIRDRLAALSDAAADVCLYAALVADPTPAVLEVALGGAERAETGIAEAIGAGILERSDGRLRFGHPLLASVAVDAAGPVRRRAAHARLGAVLTEPEARARHLALASDRRSEREAGVLEDAAAGARRRGASDTAAELAELAFRRTPLDRSVDARRRAIAAAELRIRAGDPDQARRLLEEVLKTTPPGEPRAEILVALAESHSAGDWNVRVALLEAALGQAGNRTARIEAERLLGGAALVMVRDLPGALEHARTAVRLAEDAADPVAIALCRATACRVEVMATGRLDRGSLDLALDLESTLGDLHVVARPSFAVATMVYLRNGQFAEARRWLGRLRDEAVRIGDWDALPPILAELAEIEQRAGDWPLARSLAAEAEQVTQQIGQPGMRSHALRSLANVLAHQGDVAEARALAAEAAEDGRRVPGTVNPLHSGGIVAFIELAVGHAQAAHDAVEPLVARYLAAGAFDPELIRIVADDVQALVAIGRRDEADSVFRPFELTIQAHGSPGTRAIAARCRGMIEAAAGDAPAAIDRLNGALALHEQAAEPFEAARTLLTLGEVERRDRRLGAARRHLAEAEARFAALGASPWATLARASRARLAGRPTRTGMTETERRIVALVATGRTNREVADALFMSRHTVDSHLRQIFRLLGVRSRTELARRVALDDAGSDPSGAD
jgi:DNA-binding CsgD family transcriptional regulator/tetratricopeptide (TPR) repeat protein